VTFDLSDPAAREAAVRDEFTGCTPPPEMTQEQFLAAAVRVSDRLWRDDPPQLWRAAQPWLAEGLDGHEVMHHLIVEFGQR
jgi:hypothetical protein